MHIRIKRQDLIDWLTTVNKKYIAEGWKFCGFHNKDYNMVKIRKPYDKDELIFNEDGYKYQSLFPSVMNTKDYLFFKSRGYNFDSLINELQ